MIELDNLSIRSGPFTLSGLSLSVAEGTYAALMGGTGQGKTTILEAICGLKRVTGGRILLGGSDVTHAKPADRGVGYVPQDLGLFPMMSVRGHLEFALRVRRASRAAIDDRVAELAHLLRIEPLLARHVRNLSGGEAQRVALGRALSFRPRVLLLDEPLGALDEATRDRLCELLTSVQKQTGVTTLHITHSRSEARQVADMLIVLSGGKLAERPLADLERLTADPEQESDRLPLRHAPDGRRPPARSPVRNERTAVSINRIESVPRSGLLSLVAGLLFVGAAISVLATFFSAAKALGLHFQALSLASGILTAIAALGLWEHKRWGAWVYIGLALVSQPILYLMGWWTPGALIVPGVVVALIAAKFRCLD